MDSQGSSLAVRHTLENGNGRGGARPAQRDGPRCCQPWRLRHVEVNSQRVEIPLGGICAALTRPRRWPRPHASLGGVLIEPISRLPTVRPDTTTQTHRAHPSRASIDRYRRRAALRPPTARIRIRRAHCPPDRCRAASHLCADRATPAEPVRFHTSSAPLFLSPLCVASHVAVAWPPWALWAPRRSVARRCGRSGRQRSAALGRRRHPGPALSCRTPNMRCRRPAACRMR